MILTKSKNIIRVLAYLALILSVYSLTASLALGSQSTADYSIFNRGDSGLSEVRKILEGELNVRTGIILSSLKSLARFAGAPDRTVLVIMGPTIPYSFEETISLIQYLLEGGSVLVVDDFGKANTLLRNLWNIISIGQLITQVNNTYLKGFYFNTTAILCDAKSFYKSPINPVIEGFGLEPSIFRGVDRIVTFSPSSISLEFQIGDDIRDLPMPYGLLYSSTSSWLETDTSKALKGELSPDEDEWGGIPFSLGFILPLPNGGKFAMLTDPDIFSNFALRLEGFQNRQFVRNLFKWLIGGNGQIVIFDESHTSHLPIDPVYGLSLWLRFLTDISSSWFIAPALPFILYSIIFGYLPKEEKRTIAILSRVERSLEEERFKRRARWFRRRRDYLSMSNFLLKYLQLEMRRVYGIVTDDVEEGIRRIFIIRSDISDRDFILSVISELKTIANGEKKIRKEQHFIELLNSFERIKGLLFT